MMGKPDRITLAALEVVVMPNGEVICNGQTLGWVSTLGKYLTAAGDADVLRKALVGLLGVDGRADLEQMEGHIRASIAPQADKVAGLDAIHALLSTLPKNEP